MTFKETIDLEAFLLLYREFDIRRGYIVPTTETVKLSDGAVVIDAAFMYSDMANSTTLARDHSQEDAAKVVRAFLSTVTRVMKNRDGEIRSFDGDRVMGVFIGGDGPSRAAKAALELKWLLDNVVKDNIETWLPSIKSTGWQLSHGTGIANGETMVVRGGVRGSNDLVAIGDAPNIAAKLSELRRHRTWITSQMWNDMSYETCFSSGNSMWSTAESR